MGAASPPPSGGSSGLARASPALFAEKVLTRHKHHRKSTPPLRKTPTAQKALRALWPWLGHAGSTKFGRPRKTQAFFGAPELRPRAGVRRKPRCPSYFIHPCSQLARWALAELRKKALNHSKQETNKQFGLNRFRGALGCTSHHREKKQP